jgi:hypothetical protein
MKKQDVSPDYESMISGEWTIDEDVFLVKSQQFDLIGFEEMLRVELDASSLTLQLYNIQKRDGNISFFKTPTTEDLRARLTTVLRDANRMRVIKKEVDLQVALNTIRITVNRGG